MIQSIETVNFTATDLDRFTQELNRDGICVIRGLFDQGLIEEWAQAFARLFRDRQNRPGGLAPRDQARYYLTFREHPKCAKTFLPLSESLILPFIFGASCKIGMLPLKRNGTDLSEK